MENIIMKVAEDMELDETNLGEFLERAFGRFAKSQNWTAGEFQSQATKMGHAFQYCFKAIMKKLYPDITLTHEEEIPKACMGRGSEADFVVYKRGFTKKGHEERKLVAVIEAKGSPDRIEGVDGESRETDRPGMKRTDTVKKAISNAYQIDRTHPEALFFIVTSHKPERGSAKCMCDLVEGDIVDKIVDVTDPDDLEEMVNQLRKVM